MLRCNHCYYVAPSDTAGACARCGQPLGPHSRVMLVTTRYFNAQHPSAGHAGQAHEGLLAADDIALYFPNCDGPLITTLTNQLVFGRGSRTDTEAQIEAFDLSIFRAIERGVSRAHAVLKRYDRRVTLMDLGSTNGTQLNHNLLPPNTLSTLASGDWITLGKLSFQLYFNG